MQYIYNRFMAELDATKERTSTRLLNVMTQRFRRGALGPLKPLVLVTAFGVHGETVSRHETSHLRGQSKHPASETKNIEHHPASQDTKAFKLPGTHVATMLGIAAAPGDYSELVGWKCEV